MCTRRLFLNHGCLSNITFPNSVTGLDSFFTSISECIKPWIIQAPISKSDNFVRITCINNKCCYIAKIMPIEVKWNDTTFDNEVEITRRVYDLTQSDPFTVKIYDVFYCKVDNVKYGIYIMDRVDGTLTDIIDKMNVDQLIESTNKLVRMYKYLNSLGLYQIDVKPDNIGYIRLPDGQIKYKLLDFGIGYNVNNSYGRDSPYDIEEMKDIDSIFIIKQLFFRLKSMNMTDYNKVISKICSDNNINCEFLSQLE